jgi:diguanylate cyclase (GGDEF)-like protein
MDSASSSPRAQGARSDIPAEARQDAESLVGAERLASRSAQGLIFGAGLVTVVNATLSPLYGVDVAALRVTGLITMTTAFVVPFLPWRQHPRAVSYAITLAANLALLGSDHLHHYSRDPAAMAVYPMFFVLTIAFAGLTQPRGNAAAVAFLSGGALVWLLHSGSHGSAAWQCAAVTVPAAAILGEVVSWAYSRALTLGRMDASRRRALEALVTGTSELQGALTAAESEAIVVDVAHSMFGGHDTTYEPAAAGLDDATDKDDVCYDSSRSELFIRVRGHTGVLGTVRTTVERPDAFMLDAARLYSQHIGSRLEQLRVIDALTSAATHDVLTGLANRRAAEANVASLQPGDAVFILDLDHFKSVNDSLGHQSGDRVLTELGDYLRGAVRPTDFVARFGGEEFVMVCPCTHADDADLIASRLLDGWRKRRPIVTFSVGYSIHNPESTPEATLEHADMALYAAKREGRDRAHAFEAVIVTDS